MKISSPETCGSEVISLWPPQQLEAMLDGGLARLKWEPPRVNAHAVAGYELERTSWWPGRPAQTTVLGRTEGAAACGFEDRTFQRDCMNEYRVRAVHRRFGMAGPWSFPAALYGFQYTGYERMVETLRRLGERWPEVCRIVDGGAAAREPYRIWCAVLGTDTRDRPDRPGVLLVGNVHAGEIDGGEVCIGLLERLLCDWGNGEPAARRLLERVQLRIIPFYNPAGRSVFESGFCGRGRKNLPARRVSVPVNPLLITDNWPSDRSDGIDPNRSFDVNWSDSAAAGEPGSSTYAGERPWLSPEATAMAAMAAAFHPQISIHYHGPGGYSLMPGNWRDGSPPSQRPLHLEIGREYTRLSNPEFANGGPLEVGLCGSASLQGAAHDWCYQEFYGAHFLAEGFSGQVPGDDRIPAVAGPGAIPELVETNLQALHWMGERVRGAGLEISVEDVAGRPLVARIEVGGAVDPHCKPQFTDPVHGRYRRILTPGNSYSLSVWSEGCLDVHLENIAVSAGRPTCLSIRMKPKPSLLP
ncbi:MAG TPA: M14 family zinc carboxypeptidase [Chthoniobacteraceae bacterium]|nr:M14 family zinc carboxypeptidase [Chthoniobacteraceae bacterium]